MPVTFPLSVRELVAATLTAAPFVGPDESADDGVVVLDLGPDRRRRWAAGVEEVAARYTGDTHDGEEFPPVPLPPRALPAQSLLSTLHDEYDAGDEVTITVPSDPSDAHEVTFTYGPFTATHPLAHLSTDTPGQEVHDRFDVAALSDTVDVDIDPYLLLAAITELRVVPFGLDLSEDYPPPPFKLEVGPDGLEVSVDWPGFGTSKVTMDAGPRPSGRATCWVPIGALSAAVGVTGLDQRMQLSVPLGEGEVATVAGPVATVVEQDVPYLTTGELAGATAALLADTFGADPATAPDGPVCAADVDGRLWVEFEGVPVGIDVVGGPQTTVTAVGWLADDASTVDPSMVNLLNASTRAARVYVNDVGQLVVAADAAGLPSPVSLRDLLGRLVGHVRMIGPFVAGAGDSLPT